MLFRDTLSACPSCGCHFRRGEPRCPHCDAAPAFTRGHVTPTAAALALGLAVALPIAGGCDEFGDDSDDLPYTYNATSSSYGTATTGEYTSGGGYDYVATTVTASGPATTGGGGQGGAGGTGGAGGACGMVAEIEADCEACLAASCCGALADCEADPTCLACLAGDEASCGNAAVTLALCAHGSCDEACAGAPAVDCAPPLPAPSTGSCVDAGALCNPVTNAGCDAAQACRPDVNGPVCEVASAALCATCIVDVECPASSVCVHDGLVPFIGHCAPLCCDDADCDGTCVPLDASSPLGACIAP